MAYETHTQWPHTVATADYIGDAEFGVWKGYGDLQEAARARLAPDTTNLVVVDQWAGKPPVEQTAYGDVPMGNILMMAEWRRRLRGR